MATREEKRIRDDLRNRILHALVENNEFEVPQSMVREQKKILMDDVHQKMEGQGMTHDQFNEYSKKWDADFDKSAEFVIRSSLLVNTIGREEKLFATDEDFEKKLQEYAEQSKIEIEKLRSFYSKPENSSRLRFQMTEERVVNFLIEKAKNQRASQREAQIFARIIYSDLLSLAEATGFGGRFSLRKRYFSAFKHDTRFEIIESFSNLEIFV